MNQWLFAWPEWGQAALMLAICMGMAQCLLLSVSVYKRHAHGLSAGCRMSFVVAVFTTLSVAMMVICFVFNDFSVIYVAQHSNRHLPFFYRLTAFWGAHEGSVLLWVWMLSIWHYLLSRSQRIPLYHLGLMLAVMAALFVGFALFLLATSNPFLIGLPPYVLDGADMNPLLQDPGFVIHPPILYAGYVGLAVPFAFAVTVLVHKIQGRDWASWLRPWALVSWACLSVGIVLGSWWSYRQLGWGGWWFWDPVENASLMPWLVAAALLHGLLAVERRGVLKGFTIILALLGFILSVMGTFLVRSGVLISVHAFAVDPTRGSYLLLFLFVVVMGAYALYSWRCKDLYDARPLYLFSRESALYLNMTLLVAAMATVLLGTMYPLVIQSLSLGKVSVGPPYFNAVFAPLMVPLLLAMGWAPEVAWRRDDMRRVFQPLVVVAVAVIVISGALFFTHVLPWWAALGVALSLWIVFSTAISAYKKRHQWHSLSDVLKSLAMVVAHMGMAICVAGVVLVLALSRSSDTSVAVGEYASLGGYEFLLKEVYGLVGPNYRGEQADIEIFKNKHWVGRLNPQIRFYTASKVANPKPAVDASWWGDIYVTLAEPLNNNHWALRIYIKPLIRWIWLGGLLMALGALLAYWGRREGSYV